MTEIGKLIVYRDFLYSSVAEKISEIAEAAKDGVKDATQYKEQAFECMNHLIELSEQHGLEGNLWHAFLAFILANHENAFSTSCEITGAKPGSINEIAKHDLAIFKRLFSYDLEKMDEYLGISCFAMLLQYEHRDGMSKVYNQRIRDQICLLAKQLAEAEGVEESFGILTQFYQKNGVGLGLHKAFRIVHREEGMKIVPITNIEHVYLKDLVGYEIQKKKLIENTVAFLEGKKANNVLLFGDSGTGKSSSIKAILNEYYDRGLRMIEIYKHQFEDLAPVIEQVKDRNYKFIIYMDDLSFEDYEIEYKYLKAVIEGGLGKKSDNVLIYATSNRRHLVREKFSDMEDRRDDLHTSDTAQEKLSLVNRFGVTIYYGAPDKKQFQKIVKALADKYQIDMNEETLYLEANRWELSHGGLSGRTAQQFVNYLLCR